MITALWRWRKLKLSHIRKPAEPGSCPVFSPPSVRRLKVRAFARA